MLGSGAWRGVVGFKFPMFVRRLDQICFIASMTVAHCAAAVDSLILVTPPTCYKAGCSLCSSVTPETPPTSPDLTLITLSTTLLVLQQQSSTMTQLA